MNQPLIRAALLPFALFALSPRRAPAQTVPGKINYQGRLTDNTPAQTPITATVAMKFEIYDAATAGIALWTEPASGTAPVVVTNGIFSVLLGTSVAIPATVFSGGSARWLQITAGGETSTPRQSIAAEGYANQAQSAATATNSTQLGGVAASGYQLAPISACPANQYMTAIAQSGAATCATASATVTPPLNLSASLASPTAVLSASNGADGPGISASSTSGTGIVVTAGGAEGISATSTYVLSNGVGIHGKGSSGVWGESTGGSGVYGTSTNGAGVYGISTNNTGVYGTSSSGFAGDFESNVNSVPTVLINNGGASGMGMQVSTGGSGQAINAISASGIGITGSTTTGTGVYGLATSTTLGTVGVWGESRSNVGVGAYGVATSTSAAGGFDTKGVYGNNLATSGTSYGVYGANNSSQGAGVYGSSAGALGYGVYGSGFNAVYGSSPASNGTGVEGVANSGSNAWGVAGISSSGYGIYGSGNTGVYGGSSASGGTGVRGAASGIGSYGVYGQGEAGVYGISTTSGMPGIEGWARTGIGDNYAGQFWGNVQVNGIINKAGGTFKIDHPLDPENKYLYHSFVESPDMKNIYDGVVTTDVKGEATVTLPDWFEALNKDFRYQLTVIGEFAHAIVARKIAGNRFVIRTSKPNVEVSWQVTGIRKDPFAETYRLPVEEEKPPGERGFYLYPDAYHQPKEKGIEWATHPEMMKRVKEDRDHPKPTSSPTPPQ